MTLLLSALLLPCPPGTAGAQPRAWNRDRVDLCVSICRLFIDAGGQLSTATREVRVSHLLKQRGRDRWRHIVSALRVRMRVFLACCSPCGSCCVPRDRLNVSQTLARNMLAWQQALSTSWSAAEREAAAHVGTALKAVQLHQGSQTMHQHQQGQGLQAGLSPLPHPALPGGLAVQAAGGTPAHLPPARACLDCGAALPAGEPSWKVRCIGCWRAWKASGSKGGRRRRYL